MGERPGPEQAQKSPFLYEARKRALKLAKQAERSALWSVWRKRLRSDEGQMRSAQKWLAEVQSRRAAIEEIIAQDIVMEERPVKEWSGRVTFVTEIAGRKSGFVLTYNSDRQSYSLLQGGGMKSYEDAEAKFKQLYQPLRDIKLTQMRLSEEAKSKRGPLRRLLPVRA